MLPPDYDNGAGVYYARFRGFVSLFGFDKHPPAGNFFKMPMTPGLAPASIFGEILTSKPLLCVMARIY
jgi:hypothetical protein